MSTRLAVTTCTPAWNVSDCLDAVEQRCRTFIEPATDAHNERFDEAARAAAYHLQIGGRRIRARLALDAAHCLGLSVSTAIVLATTCELLHNASLIHDDLQDRDDHRRGTAAVWKTFGDATAICAGDLLLSAAYACLAELDDPTHLRSMLSLVHVRTAQAIQGQTADVAHRIRPVEDIDTYLRIAAGKSGALLSLPLELALLAAGEDQWRDDARAAAYAFAIGYQIADDLDDLDKDACSDVTGPALNLVWLLRKRHLRSCSIRPLPNAAGIMADCVQNTLADVDVTVDVDADVDIDTYCIALARHHLNIAEEHAAVLPRACGSLLVQLAVQMRKRLSIDSVQSDA